jgi:hypothetical protein
MNTDELLKLIISEDCPNTYVPALDSIEMFRDTALRGNGLACGRLWWRVGLG